MTKSELLRELVSISGVKKADCEKVYSALCETIWDKVSKGERLALYGIGVISVVERAARKGRNPRSGEAVLISAKKAVKFTASDTLKKAANGGGND